MASKAKKMAENIKGINERYFFGVLCSLCNQKLSVRIGYAFGILFNHNSIPIAWGTYDFEKRFP